MTQRIDIVAWSAFSQDTTWVEWWAKLLAQMWMYNPMQVRDMLMDSMPISLFKISGQKRQMSQLLIKR